MTNPNILFIFSDQQRWDTCGCYGQPLDVTPNLDRMAAEGVRFEHAFTCQPVCGPARACLQTGKYATEVGCHTNHRMLPLDEKTMAQWFSEAGYEVGYIGKWHLASCGPRGGPDDFRVKPVPPERRGGYEDYWLASDVLEFTSHSYDGHMFDGDSEQARVPGRPLPRRRADRLGARVPPDAHGREALLPLRLLHRAAPPERPQPLRGAARLEGAVRGLRRAGRPRRHRRRLARGISRLPRLHPQPGREPGPHPRGVGAAGPGGEHADHLHQRPRLALPHAQRRVQALLPRRLHPHPDARLRAGLHGRARSSTSWSA